ncbi:2418_t:CDS:2 [Racocetra fulgida]|uniref:2418_t:CDS:1 n=1 Tax=Racocetra fulgida TaxID=60492 RepID=A0A9N9F6D8_9GLOM|nr:2418_t:CDS:2 [Racocetra fulgida]
MTQKGKSTIPPECLVVVVLDATYRLEDHYETIFGTYLRPILKEQEDKEKKEKVCGLVTFGHYEPYSTIPVKSHYFESFTRFDELISEIEFLNGGIYENAVAEGLVAALEVNQDVEVHNATEVIIPSHVVKLANFKLTFSQPNEAASDKKRKCETSTSTNDTSNNDKSPSSTLTSSSPESKRVKLEIPDEQLPNSTVQQSLPTETPSNPKESMTIAKPIQPPSSKPSQASNPTIPKASTSINNIQPQMTIPQDALGHAAKTQPSVQPTTPIQIQHPPPVGTAPIQQQPIPIPGTQPMRPQMPMGPRFPAAAMKAQFQAQWNAMSPEQRSQFITMAQAAAANNTQALRQNGQLLRTQVANNTTQQMLRQQNQFLQNELAASQQNLADAIMRSKMTQLGQNNSATRVTVGSQSINNFVTSPSALSSDAQSINCFVTSPTVGGTVNPQTLGTASTSFSAPTLNIPSIPTSTQGGQISTTTVGTSVASALGVQIPAKTMASTNLNSIGTSASSSHNGAQIQVASTTSASVGQPPVSLGTNINQVLPNMPPKVNALWSGHIAWSANSQQTGLKRELTCHVTAFPGNQRKTDFMRDVAAVQNPKPHVVSFLPTPNPQASQASQDNHSTFMVLMRILDSKKLAAFVRFSHAPNPNGGIVLFTTGTMATGLKLVGLLFLDSPLPTSVTVASQPQQTQTQPQQTPQSTQQAPTLQMQLMQQQQQMLMRQQQQQQQPIQVTQQMMQSQALQQIHQQQTMQMLQQLQQQQQQNLQQNLQQNMQQQMLQRQVNQAAAAAMLQQQPSASDILNFRRRMQLLQTAQVANPGEFLVSLMLRL